MKIYDKHPEVSGKNLDHQVFMQLSIKELLMIWAVLFRTDYEVAEEDLYTNSILCEAQAHNVSWYSRVHIEIESYLEDLNILNIKEDQVF